MRARRLFALLTVAAALLGAALIAAEIGRQGI